MVTSVTLCYDENGSVIVIMLIVLVLLTIIGVSATNMSSVEQKIAGNDKNHKIVFYHSESGNYSMAKWVTRILTDNEVPAAAVHRFVNAENQDDNDLMDEAFGYNPCDTECDPEINPGCDSECNDEDLTYTMTTGLKDPHSGLLKTATSNVSINLEKSRSQQAVGGGAEFGRGASGIGERAAIEVPYWFTSNAVGPGGARASIMSRYLKLLGIPGGL